MTDKQTSNTPNSAPGADAGPDTGSGSDSGSDSGSGSGTRSGRVPQTNRAEIIVFDFDGTITTQDTFALFLRFYAGSARWVLNLILLLPIFAAYGLRLIDRNAVKARVIRRFFKNAPIDTLNARAQNFAETVIPGLIRPDALKAIKTKHQQGENLYICSASISPYLVPWASLYGFKAVLATELEAKGGVYTGEIEGWNIWGAGKTRRIYAEFAPRQVIIKEAYGDSRGDKELLLASEASFWRPFRL